MNATAETERKWDIEMRKAGYGENPANHTVRFSVFAWDYGDARRKAAQRHYGRIITVKLHD